MRVRALVVYPIKSCRGIRLTASAVGPRGLDGDRRWMLVNSDGRFLSQRTVPALARVTVSYEGERLTVSAPGRPAFHLPARPGGPLLEATVWGDRVQAAHVSEAADRWFSELTGAACRLVYQPEASRRPVDPDYGTPGDHTSLADGYPLLITTTASLDDLNGRLDVPVPMGRFRPNIVIETERPFAEDGWRRIVVAGVPIRVVKPCARCVVITTDQATGARGREPLRTLATYRKHGHNVLFGQNAIPDAAGTIRVGDLVRVEQDESDHAEGAVQATSDQNRAR